MHIAIHYFAKYLHTKSFSEAESNPITRLDRPWEFQKVELPYFKTVGTWKL